MMWLEDSWGRGWENYSGGGCGAVIYTTTEELPLGLTTIGRFYNYWEK